MSKETMTIRKAEERMVKLEEEISELITSSSFVAVQKQGELPGLTVSPEEYREKEKAKFARIEELLEQYEALSLAIEAARAKAELDYKGRKISLQQAESLKKVLDEREQLCIWMELRLCEAEDEVEKSMHFVAREREKAIREFVGGDKGAKTAEEVKNLAEIYEQMHKLSLCDPLNAEEKLLALRIEVESQYRMLKKNIHEAEQINTVEL
jgi:hypothetical protein